MSYDDSRSAIATGAIAGILVLLVLAMFVFWGGDEPARRGPVVRGPETVERSPLPSPPVTPPSAAAPPAIAAAPEPEPASEPEAEAAELPAPPAVAELAVPEPATGPRITGRVVDEDGQPVASVTVYAFVDANAMSADGWATSMTDAKGEFVLAPVKEDATYRINVQHWQAGGTALQATVEGIPAGATGVEIVLGAGASIAGVVLDRATGAPVPDVPVIAAVVTPPPGEGENEESATQQWFGMAQQQSTAMTDAAGAFTLKGLAPGRYEVRARSERHAPATSDPISLGENDERTGLVLELDAGVYLAGRVVDAQNRPVANARVVAVSVDGSSNPMEAMMAEMQIAAQEDMAAQYQTAAVEVEASAAAPSEGEADELAAASAEAAEAAEAAAAQQAAWGNAMGPARRATATAADGTFLLEHLGPGLTLVRVKHPDYAPGKARVTLPEAGGEDGLVIELAAGGRIVGQVTGPGGAKPSTGSATITAMTGSGMMMGAGTMRYAQPDDEGSYEISGLAEGQYRLMLQWNPTMAAYQEAQAEGRELSADEIQEVQQAARMPQMKMATAVVRADETVTVDFSFEEGIRIEGTARSAAGEPIANAMLQLLKPKDMWINPVMLQTDDAGAFSADNVIPGRYRAFINNGSSGPEIEIGPGPVEQVDIVFSSGKVHVRIVDAASGAGVAGLSVFLLETGVDAGSLSLEELIESSSGWGQSGAEGATTIDAGANRTLSLYVSGKGYVPAVAGPVTVTPGEEIQLGDLAVTRGAAALVRVIDAEGLPIPAARAQASNRDALPDWEEMYSQVSGADGIVRIRGLESGRHTIVVTADGFAPALTEVLAPDDRPVEVILFEGGSVEVAVIDVAGQPVEGAVVEVEPLGTVAIPSTTTDLFFGAPKTTDGRGLFRREQLTPSAYLIRVRRGEGPGEAVTDAIVDAGKVATVQVVLP